MGARIEQRSDKGFRELFDGHSLKGWHASPRLPTARFPGGPEPDRENERYKKAAGSRGKWDVEDGAIVGGQDPPGSGLGGYLVTDEAFGDFELLIEARPDWPVDTGILVRATDTGATGFQILLDHRRSGGIGGFYGNGLGGFHALPYNFDARYDAEGRAVGLIAEDPSTSAEPVTTEKRALLSYAAPVEDFLRVWKWDDWNVFRIRCEGTYPLLTTWINDLKVCELDTAGIKHPDYDREAVAAMLGRQGHISLEVHDNDPRLGKSRWWPGAVCRWRRIRLLPL
jgi:hypothetical protein